MPAAVSHPDKARNVVTDMDTVADIVSIEACVSHGPSAVSQLLDRLLDPREIIAGAATKALRQLVPMAAIAERWPDDTPYRPATRRDIPDWLTNLCQGWGLADDFTSLCLKKLKSQNGSDQDLFLRRLCALPGAIRPLVHRLKHDGPPDADRRFNRIFAEYQNRQYAPEITLSATLACQLNCPYCISAGLKERAGRFMPYRRVVELLTWAKKHGVTRIGLTGGEPTIYAHFPSLLALMAASGMQLYLASNGLVDETRLRLLIDHQPLAVTLHLTPEVLSDRSLCRRYVNNATRLIAAGVKTTMRLNFLTTDENPEAFYDVAQWAGIRDVRLALPMPNAMRANQYVARACLEPFARFLDEAIRTGQQRGMTIELAKPFPLCKLSQESAQAMLAGGSLIGNCLVHALQFSHKIVVYPDLTFSPCLGLNMRSAAPITTYRGPAAAAGSYRHQVKSLLGKPLLPECGICPLGKGGRCVGACLAYRLVGNESGRSANGINTD